MPAPPIERVGAAEAGEHVVAGVAGDDVGKPIAGAVDVAGQSQRQVLDRADRMDRIGQAEGDRGLNQVGAVAAGLVDHVAGIVDDIGVVAGRRRASCRRRRRR